MKDESSVHPIEKLQKDLIDTKQWNKMLFYILVLVLICCMVLAYSYSKATSRADNAEAVNRAQADKTITKALNQANKILSEYYLISKKDFTIRQAIIGDSITIDTLKIER